MERQTVTGTVVYGKQLGRTIGFPTANIDVREQIAVRPGVYYGVCAVDAARYRVILNIGTHPTVPEGPPTVEAHLIDYSGDLYGQRIEVELVEYMRSEQKFASIQALREQLERDLAAAKRLPLG